MEGSLQRPDDQIGGIPREIIPSQRRETSGFVDGNDCRDGSNAQGKAERQLLLIVDLQFEQYDGRVDGEVEIGKGGVAWIVGTES